MYVNYQVVDKTQPQMAQLVWKGRRIQGYFITNDGHLFHGTRMCKTWKVNGRNYGIVVIDGRKWQYRIDYMVAYTFLGMRDDAIRLIHIDDNIANDHVNNLVWYRKVDVLDQYKDLVTIEDDGSIREEWRPCNTEYNPNLGYEVSNFGMIRDSHHNMIPIYESHGYRVFYYLDPKFGNTTRIKSVHRAVAEAFIPNPNNYELVNHLDGDKYNDIITNLEWATTGMNSEHAYLQNLNSRTMYDEKQIVAVCKLLVDQVPHVQISNMTGVDRRTVSDIYRGRRWKEVSSRFTMPSKKWTPELKAQISNMIIAGKKGAEIYSELNIPYDQSAISMYERLRRELKAQGKVA